MSDDELSSHVCLTTIAPCEGCGEYTSRKLVSVHGRYAHCNRVQKICLQCCPDKPYMDGRTSGNYGGYCYSSTMRACWDLCVCDWEAVRPAVPHLTERMSHLDINVNPHGQTSARTAAHARR